MQEGLDVMDGMEGIQQSMAIAGWVGCMWLVLCDLSDFCDFCVCDELVLWVVSLETGRVPHPGSARKPQPSLLQVLFANQKLISDSQKSLLWKDPSRPNLSRKQSLGRSSQERKYLAPPSSMSSIHWRPPTYWRKLERTRESQDTSLRSPLQTLDCLNKPRNIHPKTLQWMFMLESSFCFLNPFWIF